MFIIYTYTACRGIISNKTDQGYHGWQDVLSTRKQIDAEFAKWSKEKQWHRFADDLHFDWWQFPWSLNSAGQGTKFVLKYDDFVILLKNQKFITNYIQGFSILIESFESGYDGMYENHNYMRPIKVRCSLFLFWIVADINNMSSLSTKFAQVDKHLMQSYRNTDAFKHIDCTMACNHVCKFQT